MSSRGMIVFVIVCIVVSIGLAIWCAVTGKCSASPPPKKDNTSTNTTLSGSALPIGYRQCSPAPPGFNNQSYITHCMFDNIVTYMQNLPNGTSDMCTSDCISNKIPGITNAPENICRNICNH